MNLIPGSAAAIFTACTAFHIPTLVGCVPLENIPLKLNGCSCSLSTMFERSILSTPSLAITGVSDDDSAAMEPMKLNIMITQITEKISIPAIIGFISLFGIATRNGMLLISHYNTLREEGLSLRESILHGSLDRLNPILMTALSSALALIPLALRGDLPGNEIQSPMAKVILGGLLTSTFLNAFIIPIIYEWMNRKSVRS